MQCLYARLPNGTEHNFGAENAAMIASLPPVEGDVLVASLIITEMVTRVGAGNVGEFPLHYELREG